MKIGDKKNKSAQVTIFVVIAIAIVAIIIILYLLFPKIKSNIGFESKNPSNNLQNCLEEEIKKNVEIISAQGGSLNPENYIAYQGEKIEYLCYTNEYHAPCIMQKPVLDNSIENEIKKGIDNKVKECLNSMKKTYEKKGYNVILKSGKIDVELLPKRIVVTLNNSISLTKQNSEKYDSFKIIVNNNLYELISITNSILNWETRYGDVEVTNYMDLYHDLKVEKKKQIDGSTIYILTDRNNLNKFQFASRSFAWPPGWGIR